MKKATSAILRSYDEPIRSASRAKYVTKTLARFVSMPIQRAKDGVGMDKAVRALYTADGGEKKARSPGSMDAA